VRGALERDLQAARYAANRAQRQYDASDRENRLVTDELERRWNTALGSVREIERRIEQHCNTLREEPAPTLEEFSALATQLEELWQQDGADSRLRKRIVRSLIHEVIVDVDDSAGEIVLVIHWKGNLHTEVRVPRRRRGQRSFQTAPEIVSAVRSLARICPDTFIASMLNRHGLRTGHGNFWTRERVTSLRCHHGIPVYSPETRATEGWFNLTQAARFLGVNPRTMKLAVEHGELAADHPLPDGPWVFSRGELESDGALALATRAKTRHREPAISNEAQGTFDLSNT